MTRLTRAIELMLTLVLVGCSADGQDLGSPTRYRVPGCEAFDPAPCDVLTSACQKRLFGLAACLRGNDATDMPPVVVMSQADYQTRLEAENAAEEPNPDLPQWEWALETLGLIQPGALEDAAQVSADVTFVAGVYEEDTKVVTLVDHGSDSTPETSSSVLLHEFVHALQDRESDLSSFKQAHFDTYDSMLAADAVVEGEAQFQQERYLASMLGFNPKKVDWDLLFQNGVEVAEPKLLAEPSPFTAARQYFPYDWGARYIHLGWDATGHDGVLALFASPPADTQLEMASIHALAADVGGPVIAAPTPPAEWTQIGEDTLGALGAFELVRRDAELESERSVALDWRADRLALYARTDAGNASVTAVVWLCDFASAASASAARRMFAGPLNLASTVSGTRLTVAVASDASSLPWVLASGP